MPKRGPRIPTPRNQPITRIGASPSGGRGGADGSSPPEQQAGEPCTLVGILLLCNQCGGIGVMSPGNPWFCKCGRVYLPVGDVVSPMKIMQGEPLIKVKREGEGLPKADLLVPKSDLWVPPGVGR